MSYLILHWFSWSVTLPNVVSAFLSFLYWLTVSQQVNGKKLYQRDDGVQLTVIDGHDGKVVESKEFRNSVLQGIPAQIVNYVSGLRDGWEAASLLLNTLNPKENNKFVNYQSVHYIVIDLTWNNVFKDTRHSD